MSAARGIDLSTTSLFYYEVYEEEFDEKSRRWTSFAPAAAFAANVVIPQGKELKGFDVMAFFGCDVPGCSPLSCNGLAKDIPVNKHCMFSTFDEANQALEKGLFDNSEPGPFRIFAVYIPHAEV